MRGSLRLHLTLAMLATKGASSHLLTKACALFALQVHDASYKGMPSQASPFCDEEWAETDEGSEGLGTVEDCLQACGFTTEGPGSVPANGDCLYHSIGAATGMSAAEVRKLAALSLEQEPSMHAYLAENASSFLSAYANDATINNAGPWLAKIDASGGAATPEGRKLIAEATARPFAEGVAYVCPAARGVRDLCGKHGFLQALTILAMAIRWHVGRRLYDICHSQMASGETSSWSTGQRPGTPG